MVTVPTTLSVDLDAVCARIAPGHPRHRALRTLARILDPMHPDAPLRIRLDRLESLALWLRARSSAPALMETKEPVRIARLRLFVTALEVEPSWSVGLRDTLAAILRECSATKLFCHSGLPEHAGFLGEAFDRLLRPLLPAAPNDHELDETVARMFPKRADAIALRQHPTDLLERLVTVLSGSAIDGRPLWDPLKRAVADGLIILATRVSATGLSNEIRARCPRRETRESPFFQLPRACEALVTAIESPSDPTRVSDASAGCLQTIAACRATTESALTSLERSGVSVHVVYSIEVIEKSLDRMEALIEQMSSRERGVEGAAALLSALLLARSQDRGFRDLIRNNLHLLARKVIERVGETGEHYITETRAGWRKMLLSAAGGGVLTAGTAALKFLIGTIRTAPFIDGLLASLNYSASFLLMQAFGLTLATKQPSMTAATLSASLHSSDLQDPADAVEMIARATRSQLAAAIGNVGMVIPASIGVDALTRMQTGRSFLGAFEEGTSEHVVHSLDPLHGGTIVFAAFTGLLLWLSSIAAGWLENWAVVHRIPEAIARHRIRRVVGTRVTEWLARKFSHSVAGIGGNVAIGFLLGMSGVWAKFFGVPLEVRHLTLSAGALTLAICDLGIGSLRDPAFLAASAGIVVVGILNFTVSFGLAFAVALRARQVPWRSRWRLVSATIRELGRRPSAFFFPPKET